jgi:outer membrane immunogenic protein
VGRKKLVVGSDGIFLGAFPNYGTVGGTIGGGQIGFNYQSGSIVLGLEADASWASVDGATRCAFAYFICGSQVNSLGTLAARIGVPLDHRTLLYVKAGAAWAHDKYHMNSFEFIDVLDGSQTRWGWMGGGGLEYAFAPDWSAKVEYNYLDLGTARVVFMDTVDPTAVPIDIRQNLHLIKLGINYRFAGNQSSWTDAPASSVALPLKAPPIAWNWSGLSVRGTTGVPLTSSSSWANEPLPGEPAWLNSEALVVTFTVVGVKAPPGAFTAPQ